MMSTVILRTAAKLLVPLGLVFAVFIYFKGHQTPGGGFVAGLVAAVTLIVQRMAFGGESMRKMLPASPTVLIGLGLGLALLTGLGPLMFKSATGGPLPFLTSNHGYLALPGGEYYEWATVMVFDLGVMLTVAGVVVGMIDALSMLLDDPESPENQA
jgi:multisubunit Na+/H+ antiporter MnhB subunit